MLIYSNLNLQDIQACVTVSRLGSVREAARFLGLTPSHVSKMIVRVEIEFGRKLFHRSQHGMALSSFGHQLMPGLKDILEAGENLDTAIDAESKSQPVMNIGSLSFLNQELLTRCATSLAELAPTARLRLIDIAPDQLVATGLAGAFEVALHVGKLEWTASWTSKLIGQTKWRLYARTSHPLDTGATESDVKKYAFVVPAYWVAGGFVPGNDHCPLPLAQRIRGTETSTATTAVNTVLRSDQLGFLPEIVAKGLVDTGQLKVLQVRKWPEYKAPLYLTVRSDLIKRSWLQQACQIIERCLT